MKRPESKPPQALNRNKGKKNGKSLSAQKTYLKAMFVFFAYWPLQLLFGHSQTLTKKKASPSNNFCYSLKSSHQRKAIGQESKFVFGMCSSRQDRYVHQFSDGYVDVRYQICRIFFREKPSHPVLCTSRFSKLHKRKN